MNSNDSVIWWAGCAADPSIIPGPTQQCRNDGMRELPVLSRCECGRVSDLVSDKLVCDSTERLECIANTLCVATLASASACLPLSLSVHTCVLHACLCVYGCLHVVV